MKHILASRNREVLARFASASVLLAFDFDGTLAPIVARRGDARMRRSTRALLARVARLYPCAVISGRAYADVAKRLTGAEVRLVIGNHGVEPSARMRACARQVARVLPRLCAALSASDGIDVEDKRYSIAIHYRKAPRRARAREAIGAVVADVAPGFRAVDGKCVVNLVPRNAPNKGDALLGLLRGRARRAVFVGDDVTDEDVFTLARGEDLLTIRVGASRTSSAQFFLKHQPEIDALLRALLDLRKGTS